MTSSPLPSRLPFLLGAIAAALATSMAAAAAAQTEEDIPDARQDPTQTVETTPDAQPHPAQTVEDVPDPRQASAAPSSDPEGSWVRTVYEGAQGSLVTLRCGWHRGTGFLFGSGDQVASSGRWDRCTRGVEVHLPDGTVMEVERGRVSSDHRVSLLRLPRDTQLEPLPAASSPVGVGDRVAALGRGGHGGDGAVVAVGMIDAEPGETLHADLDPHPGAYGGPVLDSGGAVVGVLARRHRHDDEPHIVPVASLETLGRDGAEAPLGRTFSFGLGPFAAMALDTDPANEERDLWLGGFGGSISATLADRLTLVGGFSVLRDTSGIFHDGLVERSVRRYQGELRLGWRLLLSSRWPVYVVPSLGASARWDTWTDRRLRVQLEDPACDLSTGSACELSTDVVTEEQDDFSIAPYVHLAFRLGFLELGYTLSLTVDAPGTLVHRFLLGARMGS